MNQNDLPDDDPEATGTKPLVEGTVTPTNLTVLSGAESTHDVRTRALATLVAMTQGASRNSDSDLDTLGQLRLVELAATQARRAVINDARSNGFTSRQIADTLAIDLEEFEQRYGLKP